GRRARDVDELIGRVPRVDVAPAGCHAFGDVDAGSPGLRGDVAARLPDEVARAVGTGGAVAEVLVVGGAERRLLAGAGFGRGGAARVGLVQRVRDQVLVVEMRVREVEQAVARRTRGLLAGIGGYELFGVALAGDEAARPVGRDPR